MRIAMPIYEYRCDGDGAFEITRRLGTALESATCSACGSQAKRVFSAAMIQNGSRAPFFAAMEQAEKSRNEPTVVAALPASAKQPTRVLPLTPSLRRLPRP
jgi:putative FmdB family regulatory protein